MAFWDTDGSGGLMGMYSNPQTAGMMGLAQGLLAASAPSRLPVSMGQAMGYGMQAGQQGFNNALGMQRSLLQMKAMQGLMGDPQGQPQGQPQQPTSLLGVQSNPSMGVLSPTQPQAPSQSAPQAPSPLYGFQGQPPQQPTSPGASIFGKSPRELFQQGMLMNMAGIQGGGEMMKIAVDKDPTLALQMPTDMQKNAAAAYGYGSPEYLTAVRGAVDKEGVIPLRPGAGYIRNGQLQSTPGPAPAGFMNVPDANSPTGWSVAQLPNGTTAVSQSAAAKTGGEGSVLPYSGMDAQGNPMPVTNRTAAATQSAAIPQIESGNNPNAVSPKGAVGAWQVMPNTSANPGFGVRPAANNSPAELNRVGKDYYDALTSHYNDPAIGAVAYNMGPGATDKWLNAGGDFSKLPQETQLYLGRWTAANAMNNRRATQGGGALYAAPPMGATTAANASQGAPSKQMADAQDSLSGADSVYQQSREALTGMIDLARNQGLGGTALRFMPDGVATRLSPEAAEYGKLHANYVSLQGKALGSGGTDSSRATINESVPTYDKPQDAKISGLTNQLNQLDLMHLKRQVMSPIFQQGNEKAYNQQSASFDNIVKPSMMPTITPILQLSGDQQRAAVQQTVKANPSMRPIFEMLFNNGMLK